MGVPLSEDLRVRVVRAVEDGLSRRQAAERFGVGVSSAIRWVDEWRRSGRTAALAQGGDRRSDRIEAEVIQRALLRAGHGCADGERPTVDDLLAVYAIKEAAALPTPTGIAIVDDLITGGTALPCKCTRS